MAQQFEPTSETQSDKLRAQRMTADEARAVIALWQQERVEQTGLTDRPAVPDVAEGLNIGVEDVQRLLSEVRARQRMGRRQARSAPTGKYARRSRRGEASPGILELGIWEEAEPSVHEISPSEAARLTKAASKAVVVGLFLLGPFALTVYGIITSFGLR